MEKRRGSRTETRILIFRRFSAFSPAGNRSVGNGERRRRRDPSDKSPLLAASLLTKGRRSKGEGGRSEEGQKEEGASTSSSSFFRRRLFPRVRGLVSQLGGRSPPLYVTFVPDRPHLASLLALSEGGGRRMDALLQYGGERESLLLLYAMLGSVVVAHSSTFSSSRLFSLYYFEVERREGRWERRRSN